MSQGIYSSMSGQTDGRTDGWTDRCWMDEWMDGRVDRIYEQRNLGGLGMLLDM